MDHTRSNFDTYGTTVTADGRRWGLSGWWDANWSVDMAAVTEALGLDERGLAAAWVKRYGGANGGLLPNFAEIQAVAEYRPEDLKSAR